MKQLENAGYKPGETLPIILGYNYHPSHGKFHLMWASTLKVGNILEYLHTVPGPLLAHNPVGKMSSNANWENQQLAIG